MKTRSAAILFVTAVLLAGCAGSVSVAPTAFTGANAHREGLSLDPAANGEEALYLGIVDGLIKQSRQGAALAFLDSYRQTGQALSPRYWLLRGDALVGVHRNVEAIEAYSKLRETALAPRGWNGQGKIAAETGDWISAEVDFHKAVEGDPANADFINNLAFAELHIDRAANAASWLQQAHELEPSSDRILTNLVIALTATGDTAHANSIIAEIGDSARREAMRSAAKSVLATLNTKGKS